jgi:acetylglutamate kinase
VPVVCSIGVDRTGALLNVNADTLAGHLAGVLRARTLLFAGTTKGVLDADGNVIEELGISEIESMTGAGIAHSGMIAKLAAGRQAVLAGVGRVAVVGGLTSLDSPESFGTRIVAQTGMAPGDCVAQHVRQG